MRKPVLLKVPGVKLVRIEALTRFINSDRNRPIDDISVKLGERKPSEHQRFVTLLDMQVDSDKGTSNPGYGLSLTILTEFGMRDGQGGTEGQATRNLIGEVLDCLGIFPNVPERT